MSEEQTAGEVVQFPARLVVRDRVAFTVELHGDSHTITIHENPPETLERELEICRMIMRALTSMWGERHGGSVALALIGADGTTTTWTSADVEMTPEQVDWIRRMMTSAVDVMVSTA